MLNLKETKDKDLILNILRRYRFNPYKKYAESSLAKLETSKYLLSDSNKKYIFVEQEGNIRGFTIISKKEWDSEILGFNVGNIDFLASDGNYYNQLEIKKLLIKKIFKKFKVDKIDYILCRIDSGDHTSINSLISSGFILIDGILTFSLNLEDIELYNDTSNVRIRHLNPGDEDQIKRIARESIKIGRFYSDPNISMTKAKKIYEIWAENSCNYRVADAVIVGAIDNEIAAFVTCRLDKNAKVCYDVNLGVIDLVATAKRFRKKGLAKHVIYGALKWFKENNIDIIEVGTQISNISASRFYESCGFRLISSSLTFRRLLNQKH